MTRWISMQMCEFNVHSDITLTEHVKSVTYDMQSNTSTHAYTNRTCTIFRNTIFLKIPAWDPLSYFGCPISLSQLLEVPHTKNLMARPHSISPPLWNPWPTKHSFFSSANRHISNQSPLQSSAGSHGAPSRPYFHLTQSRHGRNQNKRYHNSINWNLLLVSPEPANEFLRGRKNTCKRKEKLKTAVLFFKTPYAVVICICICKCKSTWICAYAWIHIFGLCIYI